MGLLESIGGWNNLFDTMQKQKIQNPFLQDLARANRDLAVSKSAISSAEAKNADDFFRSQSMAEQNRSNLLREQIGQMKNRGEKSLGFDSPFAKLLLDRQKLVAMYGEKSPQVAYIDKHIEKENQTKEGIVMYDPITGNPTVSIGGQQTGSGRGGVKGPMIDTVTGEIRVPNSSVQQNRDLRSLNRERELMPILDDLIVKETKFLHYSDKAKEQAQAVSNQLLHTDYPLPSERAGAESAKILATENIIGTIDLPKLKLTYKDVRQMLDSRPGETPKSYSERIKNQIQRWQDQSGRTEDRLARGTLVGKTNMAPESVPQKQENSRLSRVERIRAELAENKNAK